MRSISAIGAVLLTIGLLFIQPPHLVMADEPKTDTVQRTPQPTSPAMTPARTEKPTPPAEAPHIQERGIFPGSVAPGLVGPKAPVQMTAPTSSLSAIQNAIRITSKSVSVNLRIPPNLPVTVPVEISVFFSSPFQSKILTQTYSSPTGVTLLYRDAEGNGQPRPMNVEITVRELVPNGQVSGIHKKLTITPLYDVAISNLRFTMASFCDRLGKNDITFVWLSPDGLRREIKFDAAAHEEKVIPQFSWGHRGISTQTNLLEPSMQFFERDATPDLGFHPIRYSSTPLVPGAARQLMDFVLNEKASGPPGQPILSADCQTQIKYLISRKVMTFDRF